MLRIHFTSRDLTRTSIAPYADPLWESLLSLHLMQTADGELGYGRWRRHARRQLPKATQLLFELAPPRGYSPDFLTPSPGTPDIDDGLDRLAATPATQLRGQLDYLATRQRPTPRIRELAEADRHQMRRLADAVRQYHTHAIAPYWQSIDRQIAVDRAQRTRTLAGDGVEALLSTLNPGVRWEPPVLQILNFADTDLHLDGRGIVLQPSLFCWQTPTKLRNPDLPPLLVYPVRMTPGALRSNGDATGHKALGALLGRTRAAVLEATAGGCTTTGLAHRCGITPGAVSHQTTVLREAGLIGTQRRGLSVWHEITELGRRVLEGPLSED